MRRRSFFQALGAALGIVGTGPLRGPEQSDSGADLAHGSAPTPVEPWLVYHLHEQLAQIAAYGWPAAALVLHPVLYSRLAWEAWRIGSGKGAPPGNIQSFYGYRVYRRPTGLCQTPAIGLPMPQALVDVYEASPELTGPDVLPLVDAPLVTQDGAPWAIVEDPPPKFQGIDLDYKRKLEGVGDDLVDRFRERMVKSDGWFHYLPGDPL